LIEDDAPMIKNVEYVTSYNWLSGKSPIILVPGSPPAWTPPITDPPLKEDSQDVFRDINAARYTSYPLEPAFRALQVMQKDFDLQTVDVVGCGSTVGNLLRFAGSVSKPFRFDVDVVGDTVLFVRKESCPTELITDLRGYGHTFPEAYTTWDYDVRGSCSHQRVVQYDFGGIDFLIRTETDGYVKEAVEEMRASVTNPTGQVSLDESLGTMAVSRTMIDPDQQLQVKRQGANVRQDQIFDIKTRARYKSFDMNEILPRLWVNQTSKFLIAYHQTGLFNEPKIEDVREAVLQWERSNSALLAHLHALIKRIVDVVRDAEKQQCEISWDGQGPLCVTKQIGEGRRALPSDLMNILKSS